MSVLPEIHVCVQTEDFDVSHELKAIDAAQPHNCGAAVSFVGRVRGKDTDTPLSHLWLTHLPLVTETEIRRIVQAACKRWAISYAKVIHRIGKIDAGEQIVLVLTASPHRDAAYQANRCIMDYLKTEAPFWKKECFVNGEAHWAEMKASDAARTQAWQDAAE
ncbi:molybdenum cofactor biosynthesis protein MoaE [Stenoxybacter acetivorans]|uniref:molybdenum cofactor biosynthesis protein MoaE n=1 Tax=Stenoxybacter acetivorans TaxID=422441 RepID=UPI001FE1F482|nr:molybdenum cofactor biosynthesis protein MoaE [Stenoxybacter acetivorans]